MKNLLYILFYPIYQCLYGLCEGFLEWKARTKGVVCVKCGDPNVVQSWNETHLCRICFEDLYADAKLVQKEIDLEREEE